MHAKTKTVDPDELGRIVDDMNHIIAEKRWSFGPVTAAISDARTADKISMRPFGATMPGEENGPRVIVATSKGQREAMTVTNAATMLWSLYGHHKGRREMAAELERQRDQVRQAFAGIVEHDIDVILSDHQDGRINEHLRYDVEIDLLSPSLRTVRTVFGYRPYLKHPTGFGKIRNRQEHRKRIRNRQTDMLRKLEGAPTRLV